MDLRSIALAVSVLAACSSKKAAPEGGAPPRDAPAAVALDAGASPTSITIFNRRQSPVWVMSQTACAQWPVRIEAPDGSAVRVDGQGVGCATARAGSCPTLGSCQGPGVFRVEPGERFAIPWDGLAMVGRELAAGEAGPGCPTACLDQVPVAAGTYKLTAQAWGTCTGECACPVAAPAKACAKPAGLTGEPELTATTSLLMPGTAGITVVFE